MRAFVALRRAWDQLQWDGWLSRPVLVVFLLWTIPAFLYIERYSAPGQWAQLVMVSALSSLITVALLMLIRRWHPRGPRPLTTVATYLAAGALRGVLVLPLSAAWELDSRVAPWARVGQSAVWAAVLMACASVVVRRWADHHSLMAQLHQREEQLLALRGTLDASIGATRSDLARKARDELEPTLRRLRTQLDLLAESGDDRADGAITSFRLAIEEVVRPLTRSLSEGVTLPEQALAPGEAPSAVPDPVRAPLSAIVQPAATALLLVALGGVAALTAPAELRPAAAPTRLLFLAIVLLALLWLAQRAALRVRHQLPVSGLLAVLLIGSVPTAVITGVVTLAVAARLMPDLATFPVLAVALMLASIWATGFAGLWNELARNAEHSLRRAVGELESLTAVLRRELWRERWRLAKAVHGPVQSALVATSVALSQPQFNRSQIPALATALDQAMAHIDRASGPPPSLETAARDLAALWAGSARVDVDWSTSAQALIDSDPALADAVIEVMREGVSNAIRHGAAERVLIHLEQSQAALLVMTIDDDGDGPASSAEPGLGSRMLDEVAVDWVLGRGGLGTRLTVTVGLAAHVV